MARLTSKQRVILWGVVTTTLMVSWNIALFTGHPGLSFALWILTHFPAALLGVAIAEYQIERW